MCYLILTISVNTIPYNHLSFPINYFNWSKDQLISIALFKLDYGLLSNYIFSISSINAIWKYGQRK